MLRYAVMLIAFPAIVALERFAHYAARSQLFMFMRSPAADGGLEMSTEALAGAFALLGVMTGLAPLFGGLVAIATGPRIPMVAGAVCAALGYGAVALASPATLMLALALWALGYGLLLPSLYASLGREVAQQSEGLRAAPFVLMYAAVNAGALVASPAAMALRHLGAAPSLALWAAMGMMLVVALGVGLLALFGTAQRPPTSGGRVELGLLVLLTVLVPPIAAMGLGFEAVFSAAASSPSAELLFSVNPAVVILVCLALAVAMLVLGGLKQRPPTMALLGVGAVLAALGAVPLLLGAAPPSTTIAVTAVVILALSEPLALGLGAARMATGTHPRFAVLIFAVWLATNRGVFALAGPIQVRGWGSYALAGAAFASLVAGVLLLAFGRLLQRECFEPAAAAPVGAGGMGAPPAEQGPW